MARVYVFLSWSNNTEHFEIMTLSAWPAKHSTLYMSDLNSTQLYGIDPFISIQNTQWLKTKQKKKIVALRWSCWDLSSITMLRGPCWKPQEVLSTQRPLWLLPAWNANCAVDISKHDKLCFIDDIHFILCEWLWISLCWVYFKTKPIFLLLGRRWHHLPQKYLGNAQDSFVKCLAFDSPFPLSKFALKEEKAKAMCKDLASIFAY